MSATKDRKLTPKQEGACQDLIKTGNKSEAYRRNYSADNMTQNTLNVEAHKFFNIPKISLRVKELRAKAAEKYEMTIDKAVKFDTELIEHYQRLLRVLDDPASTDKQIEAAKRTMRYIGTPAYNGAMDRVAKMKGYFEKDNTQKKSDINVFQIPDNERE